MFMQCIAFSIRDIIVPSEIIAYKDIKKTIERYLQYNMMSLRMEGIQWAKNFI